MMKLLPVLLYCLVCSIAGNSQQTVKSYPKDYFRNPLDIPIFLAGNFGECRPGHFHSGMDIKTLGEENQPVHDAADGYVSRIKMEKGGFGHAIYITHPNGYTTLYAHLNTFFPELQKVVHDKQYELQRWDVDMSFGPPDFPVKKGIQIAWSGNTGASTAPHLHFEIRNTATEHPLNPELFGFELTDQIKPVVNDLVLYSGNTYQDSVLTLSVTKGEDCYHPAKTDSRNYRVLHDTVEVRSALTGIGINTDDFMDGSDNTLAPYTIQWFVDDTLQGRITLDDIGYDETRYINAYADYNLHEHRHKWEQCLFLLPGNRLNKIYTQLSRNMGRIDLTGTSTRKILILITDDKDNTTTVAFVAKPVRAYKPATPAANEQWFKADRVNEFSRPGVAFTLGEKQLYDDVFFRYSQKPDAKAVSALFQLHDSGIPLHQYFELKLKPNKPIPLKLRNKIAMRYSDGEDEDGRAAQFNDNGWYTARVRAFGDYKLVIDTVPPVIKSLQKSTDYSSTAQITFEVKDSLTSVRKFSGYLDGDWVCFEQHGSLFFYKFDEHCPKGKHKLIFNAEDENGNKKALTLNFTR